MKVVIVNQTKGNYFGVHRVGCSDVTRRMSNGHWIAEGDSIEAIIAEECADFAAQDQDFEPGHFDIYPCCSTILSNTPKEATNMSTKTAKTIAKRSIAKPAPTKEKIVTKTTAKQKSKTVTLKLDKSKTKGKARFDANEPTLLSAVYLTREFFALLKTQKTADLTFTPAEKQPKHSFRFNEVGDDQGIGSLYILKDGATKVAKLNDKATVKVRVQRSGDDIKLTVSVA